MEKISGRDHLIAPSKDEAEMAKIASRVLARARDSSVNVIVDGGETLTLPKSITGFLVHILTELSNGNMVDIVPVHAELTTQEAANHLNVSRPYLIKLLEDRKIPFSKVGTHRRIRYEDLSTFMDEQEKRREVAMTEIAALDQELDLS